MTTNWSGNIDITAPLAAPATEAAVVAALEHAVASKTPVRPIAGRYSSSWVLEPARGASPGTLLSTLALRPEADPTHPAVRLLDASDVVKPAALEAGLVRVWAGAQINDVNVFLARPDVKRALPMMGAFSGQTFIGAAATSTHGSGRPHGVLADAIVSIELCTVVVVPGGARAVARFRVEPDPSDAITDVARFAKTVPGVTLVQSTAVFDAVRVAMGYFGVITSVVVRTVPAFGLRNDREITTWKDVRARLRHTDAAGFPAMFSADYGCGVTMSPYRSVLADGSIDWATCAISRLSVSDPVPGAAAPQPCPLATVDAAALLTAPRANYPQIIDGIIRRVSGNKVEWGRSDQVLATPQPFIKRGFGLEYAFLLDPSAAYLDAVESMLGLLVTRQASAAGHTLAGFVTLRFVRSSRAHLAINRGRDGDFFCIVEVLSLTDYGDGRTLLPELAKIALSYNGRPHWGQVFATDATMKSPEPAQLGAILALYGKGHDAWNAARDKLGIAREFFANRIGEAL